MHLAIGTTFDYAVPLETQLAEIERAGFEAVSLGANLGHCDFLQTAVQAEVRLSVLRHSLEIDSLHVPIAPAYDISKKDPESRMAAVCRVALAMAAAVELNAGIVILHLCYHAPRDYEQDLQSLLDSLDVLIESAENMGIKLAAENLVTEPSHTFLAESLATFDSKHYGLCYDSSHAQLTGRQPLEWLERFGDRLLAVHLSDNDGQQDRHWLPFTGIVDWKALTNTLRDNDFSGSLLLEVENREGTPTPEFLRQAADSAMRLREMIEG
ncbi:MAG: sugar phosphate isomerase/epimerase family protein [bacterium]